MRGIRVRPNSSRKGRGRKSQTEPDSSEEITEIKTTDYPSTCPFDDIYWVVVEETFLRSKCRFVLLPGVVARNYNWSQESMRPSHIFCVLKQQEEEQEKCPICMEDFSVPLITRCGHVFCAKCIFTVLSTGFSSGGHCPWCGVLMMQQDLKLVLFYRADKVGVGDVVNMLLCARLPSQTVVHSERELNRCTLPSLSGQFIKRKENQWLVDEFHSAPVFHLTARVFKFPKNGKTVFQMLEDYTQTIETQLLAVEKAHEDTDLCKALHSVIGFLEHLHRSITSGLNKRAQKREYHRLGNKKPIYFYQCPNTYFTFLHPSIVEQLSSAVSNPRQLPSEITGRVVSTRSYVVNQETSKFFNCISHLFPYTSLQMCILELTVPPTPLLELQLPPIECNVVHKRMDIPGKKFNPPIMVHPNEVLHSPNTDSDMDTDVMVELFIVRPALNRQAEQAE